MDPTTLRFKNATIEDTWVCHSFRRSSKGLIGSCAVALQALSLLASQTHLTSHVAFGAVSAAGLLIIVTWVAHNTTAPWALRAFAWVWAVLWTLACTGLGLAFSVHILHIALLYAGIALLQHLTPLGFNSRLINITAAVIIQIACSYQSTVGSTALRRDAQMLIVSGALLLGELIGRPLELRRRQRFQNIRTKPLVAHTTTPSSPPPSHHRKGLSEMR